MGTHFSKHRGHHSGVLSGHEVPYLQYLQYLHYLQYLQYLDCAGDGVHLHVGDAVPAPAAQAEPQQQEVQQEQRQPGHPGQAPRPARPHPLQVSRYLLRTPLAFLRR